MFKKRLAIQRFLAKTLGFALIVFVGMIAFVPSQPATDPYEDLYKQIVDTSYIFVQTASDTIQDEEIQNEINDLLFTLAHPSAPNSTNNQIRTQKQNQLCVKYSPYCKKIKYDGDRMPQEKYMYTVLSVYFPIIIDSKIDWHQTLLEILETLVLKQQKEGSRGVATHTALWMNVGAVDSHEEFAEVLTHELSHVIDLGILKGTSDIIDKKFTEFGEEVFAIDDPSLAYYSLSWESEKTRKAQAESSNFCSGYAMKNPFEDFAECMNLYLNHQHAFFIMAQQDDILYKKYQYFANIYNGDYIYSPQSDIPLAQQYAQNGKRPRDTTKFARS